MTRNSMKSPLILLFTRNGDFAQSVRDASLKQAQPCSSRGMSATDCKLFVNAAVSSIPLGWIR